MGVACLVEGEDGIVVVVGGVHAIEEQTIVVDVSLLQAMLVSVDNTVQLFEELQVVAKRLCHIIVELVRIGSCVHHHHTVVIFGIATGYLVFHKVKVGHCCNVVIFRGISVQTYKFGAASNKAEIHFAKDVVVCFVASAQKIVIANQCHPWLVQLQQSISTCHKFFGGGAVGQVAAMDDKVDIVAGIDVANRFFQCGEPSM